MFKIGQKVMVKSREELREGGYRTPRGKAQYLGQSFVIQKIEDFNEKIYLMCNGEEVIFPPHLLKEIEEVKEEEVKEDFKVGQVVQFKKEEEVEGRYYPRCIREHLNKDFFIKTIEDEEITLEYPDGRELLDSDQDEMFFEKYLLKLNTKSKLKQLEVGDVVDFIDKIEEHKRYGVLVSTRHMANFQGRKCTVSEIDSDRTFKIKEDELGYWFDKSMLKQYQDCTSTREIEMKVGNKVKILDYLQKRSYEGSVNFISDMEKYLGKTGTITRVQNTSDGSDLMCRLDISGGYWWTKSMLEYVIYNISNILKEDTAIFCENISQRNELFKLLKQDGYMWMSGATLNEEDESDFYKRGGTCYKINEDKKITYGSKETHEGIGCKIIKFSELFTGDIQSVADREFNATTSKKVTKQAFINRDFRIGDIYYLDDEKTTNHNGWRIAMNGYSIGLNSYDNKSWTSLRDDRELRITKIIPTDKKVNSYANMSLFLKTLDEKLVEDMIIEIVE